MMTSSPGETRERDRQAVERALEAEAARKARLAFACLGQARVLAYCPDCDAQVDGRYDGALRPVDGFWPARRHVNATLPRRRQNESASL